MPQIQSRRRRHRHLLLNKISLYDPILHSYRAVTIDHDRDIRQTFPARRAGDGHSAGNGKKGICMSGTLQLIARSLETDAFMGTTVSVCFKTSI